MHLLVARDVRLFAAARFDFIGVVELSLFSEERSFVVIEEFLLARAKAHCVGTPLPRYELIRNKPVE